MGRKKEKRRKPRPPKLSALDRAIYGGAFLLVFTLYIGGLLAFVLLKRAFTLINPNLIAYIESGSIFFALPAWLYLFLSCLIFVLNRWTDRRPIFGKKGVEYSAELWPMFSKRKRPVMYERPSHIRCRKLAWWMWFAGLAFVLCLVPFSLFAKKTVSVDGDFYDYGLLGSQAHYDEDDIDSLEIGWRRRSYRRGWLGYHFTLCMEFTMRDGTVFTVLPGSFRSEFTTKEELQAMLRLKSLVSETAITYEGIPDMYFRGKEPRLNAEEDALLNTLFDREEAP